MTQVIERDLREGSILPDLGHEIQWVQSYVTADRTYSIRVSHVRTIDATDDD